MRPRWNPEGVGCKGGTSATAGKKASTYETSILEAPQQFRKRSFTVHSESAWMALYKDLSGAIGVASEPKDWGDVIWTECYRIDGIPMRNMRDFDKL